MLAFSRLTVYTSRAIEATVQLFSWISADPSPAGVVKYVQYSEPKNAYHSELLSGTYL